MALNWQLDKEYISIIDDIIALDDVQRLETFVHHHYTNRLAHSISVSYRSYRWAKRLGLNKEAVARAGLLHDLFFYDLAVKDEVGGKGHLYEHPRIALNNAMKLVELSDLEQDIILKHMFGATLDIPKYAESWIVTFMDKEAAISEVIHGSLSELKQNLEHTAQVYSKLIKPALFFNTKTDKLTN